MFRRKFKHRSNRFEFNPDEILLDARNLPEFNAHQFEGRIEKPISKRSLRRLFYVMMALSMIFIFRLGVLQIALHAEYQKKSEQNSLNHIPIFADRGVIYDRYGVELAWNSLRSETDPAVREYIASPGFANLLGYVSYPKKDKSGNFWQTRSIGKDGIEKEFDELLAGKNGTQLIETDVSGNIYAGNVVDEPEQGKNITLSIDAAMQEALHGGIKNLIEQSEYTGGAGAVMDIQTGELLAMTTYPEYDQRVLADADDKTAVKGFLTSSSRPFLHRMTEGLYTPGSIVKPFLALGALEEGIISPSKVIHTTGELRVPNPYNPGNYTVFKDNADHGDVNMRRAIAISSNVYFYQIGGGFGTQEGLGIANIEKYTRLFGIGEKTGINYAGELSGTIPSIEWKAKHFPGDPWRIGNTYHTAIGQYGFQVTPIQMLRAVAGIASRGTLVTPTVLKQDTATKLQSTSLPITDAYYSVVHDAMRAVVTEGTAPALNNPSIAVAAKTGTAQIKANTRVNSWVIGFFPLEKPRYAFTVLMEDGPRVSVGAAHAMKPVLEYLALHPELLAP